tara:strand:+ start:3567 stop:3848 length:282 start_codon:yes stop_codon:yes gene_type:complete
MTINLSPISGQVKTIIEIVDENTLIYNGVTYDFTAIPNGGEVQASEPATGKITKDSNGIISISLQWFYDSQNCVYADRFPNNPYNIAKGVLNV